MTWFYLVFNLLCNSHWICEVELRAYYNKSLEWFRLIGNSVLSPLSVWRSMLRLNGWNLVSGPFTRPHPAIWRMVFGEWTRCLSDVSLTRSIICPGFLSHQMSAPFCRSQCSLLPFFGVPHLPELGPGEALDVLAGPQPALCDTWGRCYGEWLGDDVISNSCLAVQY